MIMMRPQSHRLQIWSRGSLSITRLHQFPYHDGQWLLRIVPWWERALTWSWPQMWRYRGRGALEFTIFYLHSDHPTDACNLGKEIPEEAFLWGDGQMALGDWNRLPHEAPAAPFLFNGCVHAADDVELEPWATPTHGTPHIDYAVCKGIYPSARCLHKVNFSVISRNDDQEVLEGTRQNSTIWWCTSLKRKDNSAREKGSLRWPLTRNGLLWGSAQERKTKAIQFAEAAEQGDTDLMWTPWIDAAARLSEKNESNTNDHKSSWGSEAIKEHYIAPAASNMQSAAEVKIRRAVRHSTDLQVNSSKHLQMKFRRNIRRLSEIYPGVLQEDGDSIASPGRPWSCRSKKSLHAVQIRR